MRHKVIQKPLFPDDETIRKTGHEDGAVGLPSGSSYDAGPFERSIISAGESKISEVYSRTATELYSLEGKSSNLANAYESNQYRLKEVLLRYRNRKDALGRDIVIPIPYMIHWTIIILLGIGEFPLNVVVFRMFGEPELMTYVMSLTLSITLPLIGVFLGLQIRTLVKPKIASIIMIALAPATVLGALTALSFIRNMYVTLKVEHKLSSGSGDMMYAMFAINLLIFMGAYMVSFFAHDQDSELDALHTAVVRLDRKRTKLRNKLSKAISITNAIIRAGRGEAERILSDTSAKLALYRQANMASRGGNVAPPSFSKNPTSDTLKRWWPDLKIPDAAEATTGSTNTGNQNKDKDVQGRAYVSSGRA
jgi:hypothetical protein